MPTRPAVKRREKPTLPPEPPRIVPVQAAPFHETFMVGEPGLPARTARFMLRHLYARGGLLTTVFSARRFYEWDALEYGWVEVDEQIVRAAVYNTVKAYGRRLERKHVNAVFWALKNELTWPSPVRIDLAA